MSLLSGFLIFVCTPCRQAIGVTDQPPAALKIALLPFENNSGRREAARAVMPLVRDYLTQSGYELLNEQDLERFLVRNRIRRTGEISRKNARQLGEELGADLIAVGAVEVFTEIDPPQVGLSCRFVDPSKGSILWAESVGVTGDDFTTILGLGTIRSVDLLGIKAVESLFRTLRKTPTAEGDRTPASKKHGERPKVALLPFENLSGRKAAGRIVSNIVITRLVQKGYYEVVEPGEVRNQIIELRVRHLEAMGIDTMSELGREAEADYLLLGSVEDYREEVREGFPPRVEVHARLIDADKGRSVWAGSTFMTGDDFLIVLDFGKIRSIVPLARKAANRIIKGMVKTKTVQREWRSAGDTRWRDSRLKTQNFP